MNLSDPETYREMASSLRDMAARSDRPERRVRLRRLATRCELMAARIESGRASDYSSEIGFGGDAA
jgi:hypothetical protein